MTKVHVGEIHGVWWACAEYDHGPLCRWCVPITPVLGKALKRIIAEHSEATQALEILLGDKIDREEFRKRYGV